MSFYIRKISRSNIKKMREATDVVHVPADVIGSEFRTKGNTLSVWEVSSKDMEELGRGILAIALTSSKIETMDFLVMDKEALEKYHLDVCCSEPIKNPMVYLKNSHHDICQLTLGSLTDLIQLYKSLTDDEPDQKNVVRKTKDELVNLIKKAYRNDEINIDSVEEKIREDVKKLVMNRC